MPFDPTASVEVLSAPGDSGEQLRPFIPTPERVSQYLELKTDEVTAQMKSVEGRQELVRQLLEHEEDLKNDHADFQPELLQTQLDEVGNALTANELYLQDIQSPEQKGMFRRAWESVKGFAKAHPVVTTLLIASLAAGGVAGGFYLTGNWELLMATTGLSKIFGAAEAAGELVPPTPLTPPLPGGGVFEIPPPISPPDLGIPT